MKSCFKFPELLSSVPTHQSIISDSVTGLITVVGFSVKRAFVVVFMELKTSFFLVSSCSTAVGLFSKLKIVSITIGGSVVDVDVLLVVIVVVVAVVVVVDVVVVVVDVVLV